MIFLRSFKPIFALGMLTIMCSTSQSTKRDTLQKIKRILMDFETVINKPEKSMIWKDSRETVKRQFSHTYPCMEIKEELSVAELVKSKHKSPNNGQDETRYFPSTVVTFKCSSLGFRYNRQNGLPCRCKQRYRQVYFQARQGDNCRNWKPIPVTIQDGCHCVSM